MSEFDNSLSPLFLDRYRLPACSVFALLLWALFLLAGASNCYAQEQKKPDSSAQKIEGYTLSPEKYQKAVSYARTRYALYFISFAYEILLIVALLSLRVFARFRDWAQRSSSRRIIQAAIFCPLFFLTLGLLELPLDLYGHSLRLKYEQSIQSWGSWFWDWTKGQLIGLTLATAVVWILYGVIRRSPGLWWLYFWVASLPIIIFVLFITPILIEPLFFKFDPLLEKQPHLVSQIERITQRGGLSIPREQMFEMKASEKMKSVNAYVTGFSSSKRVVVWDTTLQKMTVPQALVVFGHEMGHYVLNHVMKTVAFISVILLIFLYIGSRLMKWLLQRWGERWDVHGVDDWASLPVLLLLFSIFTFLASPIISTYSRSNEHDADIYGLEVVHGIIPDSQTAAAQAFQVLGEINLSDPDPPALIKFWFFSHPPLNERLIFARDYDPWSKGEDPKFVK